MISVIMATCNGEKFILQQLESIKKQTLKVDEVIIRDDCSSDNTCKLIQEYIDRNALDWKFVQNDTRLGFVKNFYEALRLAGGDYIFLCDQDDIWLPDKAEKMSDLMSRTKALMIHSDVNIINEDGKVIEYSAEKLRRGIHNIDISEYIKVLHYCGMSSVMSKELQRKCIGVSPDMITTHDWFWGFVAALNDGFYTTGDVYSLRRIHGQNQYLSIGRKPRRAGVEQRCEVIQRSIDFYSIADKIARRETENLSYVGHIDLCRENAERRKEIVGGRDLYRAVTNISNVRFYPSLKSYFGDIMYVIGVL
jgi:glycosyltransferase involved in cell wall biosynthesis